MRNFIEKLARLFALLGGTMLMLLIMQTCLSVAGRSLNSLLYSDFVQTLAPSVATALLATGIGPIKGDFELVEAGMAFVVFAFLPLCQLEGGHASVDIFTKNLPQRANKFLQMLIDVLFAVVLVIIAWQLFHGLISKQNSGQTTLLLQFPVWWAYALSLLGAVAAAVVAVYVAAISSLALVTRRAALPPKLGTDG